jgi:hypothetical protein
MTANMVLSHTERRIKNGTVRSDVMTAAPATPIPGAPDCPNPQGTERITDMSFTSAVITVQQPPRHYRAHRELHVQLADQ